MHCASCELLIEEALTKVVGVTTAFVSRKKGTAEIHYNGELNEDEIKKTLEQAGYTLGEEEKKPFFSRNLNDYSDILLCITILGTALFFVNKFGLFHINFFSGTNSYSSLPIVFLIGLTAGLSTCMALVGGLILGASARFAEKYPQATTTEKFKPHLFFNLGRIVSYFILGGLVGYLGSLIQISVSSLGLLTIAVGLVMLTLGLQLTGLFPRLSGINFTIPKGISKFLGIKAHSNKEYSHKNSLIMGALTFFLPCGFTQAMQLYAMSSGDPVIGAFTLGTFAIGTAPGLLGVGGLTAVIKGAFAKMFFKFAGLVVIALSFFNILNGYNLTGINLNFFSPKNVSAQASDENVTVENGVQVVRMVQNSSGYEPNSFVIKKNIPVRWIVNSTDPYSCASSIVSAELNVRQALQAGENVIEFTPTKVGSIRFSCSMGMYNGVFTVVDQSADTKTITPEPVPTSNGSCGGKGGCGCGAKAQQVQAGTPLGTAPQVTLAPTVTPVATQLTTITPLVTEEATVTTAPVQVIKATYTERSDVQPNSFTVKANIPVRFEIEAKNDGYGCMGSMTIPGLTRQIEVFTAGQTMVFEFTPTKPGRYSMTCAMGVPRGVIQVN